MKTMQFNLKKCRSCGGKISSVLDLGQSPIANALLESLTEASPQYPLGLVECEDCTLVQNLTLLPDKLLFPHDYPYFASTSKSVVNHAKNIAEALFPRLCKSATTLEIGSNDGAVQRALIQRGIRALGVDPAAGPAQKARELGCEVYNSGFNGSIVEQVLTKYGAVDAVLMSNVLAHVTDPSRLLKDVRKVLAPDGTLMIEVQSWLDLVDAGAFDMVYHEHHCHFSLTSIAHLLENAGFGIIEIEKTTMQGGSLRLWCKPGIAHNDEVKNAIRQEAPEIMKAPARLRHSFTLFRESAQTFANSIGDTRLFGYGAAAKTVTLLAATGGDLGLDGIADAAPSKIGKFLPIGGIPIISPRQLAEAGPEAIILFAWNLADEIIPKLPEAEIWLPIPKFERIK